MTGDTGYRPPDGRLCRDSQLTDCSYHLRKISLRKKRNFIIIVLVEGQFVSNSLADTIVHWRLIAGMRLLVHSGLSLPSSTAETKVVGRL